MATKVFEKSPAFYDTFERKGGPAKQATHYCPGCGHGNIHKMMAEALHDLGLTDRTVLISPVGCSVFAYYYFDCGNIQAAHGRAPAVATGVKRANPNAIVMSYQGDGDLAAIGTAETIHAANRGENITVFFVNNAIYGMTGGQMAPTTMIGQKTATTPLGRVTDIHGNPIRMAELIASLPAPTYIERVAIGNAKHVMKARKAIRKALKIQAEGRGYSFVEILSPCPTGWKMDSTVAREWMLDEMTKVFPLGVFRDESDNVDEGQWDRIAKPFDTGDVNAYLNRMAASFSDADPLELPSELTCKFAGFGGQGILTLGLFLSQIAMRAGSSKRIGSPLVEHPNVLVVMNQPSLEAFEQDVVDGGTILVDTTIVEGRPDGERLNAVLIPASEIADEVGTPKVANVVMLGAICAATGAFPPDFVESTLRQIIKKKSLIEMNMAAFRRGYEFVKKAD